MSLVLASSGGRFPTPPMSVGVTVVAAADFDSNVCTLKMNPTSTAGQKQVTGQIVTVTPGAGDDDLVLPPVGQCKGMILYVVNSHSSNNLELKYVNSSGSVAELQLANSDIAADEIATCLCDGTYWYAMVTTAT